MGVCRTIVTISAVYCLRRIYEEMFKDISWSKRARLRVCSGFVFQDISLHKLWLTFWISCLYRYAGGHKQSTALQMSWVGHVNLTLKVATIVMKKRESELTSQSSGGRKMCTFFPTNQPLDLWARCDFNWMFFGMCWTSKACKRKQSRRRSRDKRNGKEKSLKMAKIAQNSWHQAKLSLLILTTMMATWTCQSFWGHFSNDLGSSLEQKTHQNPLEHRNFILCWVGPHPGGTTRAHKGH